MTTFFARIGLLAVILITASFPSKTDGDEIVVDRLTNFQIGDFECSKCVDHNTQTLSLTDKNRTLTAGEVWRFFDAQGYESLDRLRLNFDVQPISDDEVISLSSIQLKIEDPNASGHLLTNVSLQGNSLTLPGYETYSYKPEAQFEFELGYDFMTRFSADSKEQIVFGYSSDGNVKESKPAFVLAGSNGFFSKGSHSIWLVFFAGFWVAVFFLLHRFTKPTDTEVEIEKAKIPAIPGSHRALSA